MRGIRECITFGLHKQCMVAKEDQFRLRSNRTMSYSHQIFAIKASNANICHVLSSNLEEELTSSGAYVGCMKTDFKNSQMDICSFVGDKYSQLITNNFMLKRK